MAEEASLTDAPITKPRRWWGAGLLTLFGNGAGYLYVGRPRRAFVAAIVSLGLVYSLWHGLWGLLARPWVFFVFLVGGVGAAIFFVGDSIRIALRRRHYVLQGYNTWWVYLGWALIVGGFVNVVDVTNSGVGLKTAIRTFSIGSGSTIPTIDRGDYFVADMLAYATQEPDRGDLAIFLLPRDNKTPYIKRIVGLPGDKVQMVDGALFINGTPVQRDSLGDYFATDSSQWAAGGVVYEETWPNGHRSRTLDIAPGEPFDDTELYEVPAEHYFVLGDNRDNSMDSRISPDEGGVGYVPVQNILGKPSWIFWSRDLSRIGTGID